MPEDHPTESSGHGLEGLCGRSSADWIRHTEPAPGIQLLQAWLPTLAYRRHRHDTYAIGLTEIGIQAFAYRGAERISMRGQVVVLHPDEAHDGYAGSDAGFGYRQIYIEPAVISAAVRQLCGHRASLPFVPQPVIRSATLAAAIRFAFGELHEPLARDDLVMRIAGGLLAADPDNSHPTLLRHVDIAAIERARQFLEAETTRVVRSAELEAVAGLSRFDLARQFRAAVGTSPYRYSLMRRLARAQALIEPQRSLADIALETGFADQAHFTRQFTATYGITPGQFGALHSRALR